MVARVPVLEVRPCLDRGRFPAKVVPGEPLTVEALVLPDTVDVGAAVVLTAPDGTRREPVPMQHVGDHVWSATVAADEVGAWTYHVESWQESLRTWAARVVSDIDHGADPETVLAHGSALVLALGSEDPAALEVGDDLLDTTTPAHERLAEGLAYVASLPDHLGRADVGSTEPLPLRVDPERALVGAWYRLAPSTPDGTLADATARLDHAAALGFDVVRLPPLHPTRGRPWHAAPVVGAHLDVDARLGTVADLDALVQRAHQVGLEVALELTWTVASGHPWLERHAGWFVPTGDDTWRLDPDAEPAGVLGLVLETLVGWADRGVSAFVVRDAHHWPLGLWEHVLRELAAAAPDVLLLSEGDASPAQAHALALVGFHQTTPALHDALGVADVEDVLAGVGRGSVTRTHLVAAPGGGRSSTLDDGGAATRCAWAAVAALGSPAWETSSTLEEVDGPSSESEPDVVTFLGRLNELRRAHPALRRRRGLVLHRVHHAGVLAFSRSDGEDTLLVVVDLFPAFPKSVGVPDALGSPGERLQDELDGTWHTLDALTLDPAHPVRVLTARR